jgi:hypothetical protein
MTIFMDPVLQTYLNSCFPNGDDMHRFNIIQVIGLIGTLVFYASLSTAADVEYGLASLYPKDHGIQDHSAVIAATGFETPNWAVETFGYTRNLPQGYQHTTDPTLVLEGNGCLQIQQTAGTHQPYEFAPEIPESDIIFVRWYRRYETGYQWTQHKMPGVYAKESRDQDGTAGVPPTGCDKYSCKLFVDWNANPAFYTYHPDQEGIYGDHFKQNIGEPVALETQRWYCFEMMLKSNTPDRNNGELKMWIDGVLKGHVTGLRFRTCDRLKINEFTHSAYVGGNWVSERDQRLWDDNLVIATEYIGPMTADDTPDQNPEPEEDPSDPDPVPNDDSQEPAGTNSTAGSGDGGCFIGSFAYPFLLRGRHPIE